METSNHITLRCRVVRDGNARGTAVKSSRPLSFFGGVDPGSGRVVEKGHPLEGRIVGGSILVFPAGKGSTVGSYILYRMAKAGTAPAGMVVGECDSVVAVGAVIAGIPCVDRADIGLIGEGDDVEISGEEVTIRKVKP
jgi:predicted aconitase with swiveling domain